MKTFLYLNTVDLPAARRFYSVLLELDEIVASVDVVGFRIGSLQLTIARHEAARYDEVSDAADWASQLGWVGGKAGKPSWGMEVADEAFGTIVARLQAASVRAWSDEPQWVGYWSFPVMDPMGNTVEVSAAGEEAWAGGMFQA